jgi:hypothetical protein
MQLLRNIERGEARLPEAVAGRLSAACKGLLGRLLQRNPVERITFEEFFQHPFLSGSTGAVGHTAAMVVGVCSVLRFYSSAHCELVMHQWLL